MTQLIEKAVGTETYLAAFDRAATGGPAWLHEVRARAIARFSDLGFPTTREEEWRFTSVAPIAQRAFRPAPAGTAGVAAADLAPALFGDGVGRLVFVNGRYAAGLSELGGLPAGVEVGDLGAVLASRPEAVEPHLTRLAGIDQAFTALNTAFFDGGALVMRAGRRGGGAAASTCCSCRPRRAAPRCRTRACSSSRARTARCASSRPTRAWATASTSPTR